MAETTIQLKNWTGKFGRKYTDRNILSLDDLERLYIKRYGITRTELNKSFLNKIDKSIRILEIGSNVGNQLLCLQKMGFKNLYGIEPQTHAIELSKKRTGDINIIKGDVFDIPFKDKYFDLVFTSGLLIHIHPKNIKKAIKEIYRCSRRYIWGFEYYSDEYREVPYRGKKNLLWKADFPRLYLGLFSDLKLIKEKYLKYLNNENIDVMFFLKKANK